MLTNYRIIKVTPNAVHLEDLDNGRSVTNTAEEVVAEVFNAYPNRRIIYLDTMGCWGELVHNHGIFTGFAPVNGELPE